MTFLLAVIRISGAPCWGRSGVLVPQGRRAGAGAVCGT